MGSDDLFKKRKKRTKEDLKRRAARRDPFDVVLIVCEGEKTEPYYLQEMRDDLGLNADNVVITGDCGSSPDSVARQAIRRFEQEPEFDRVYCVFDRDSHQDYDKALERIRTTKLKKGRGRHPRDSAAFIAITSVPCFEFWLLLHFEYSTAPFHRTQQRSPCDAVIAKLKHGALPEYAKGASGWYERTKSRRDRAMQNAERALQAAEAAGTDNPTTRMHELIAYLLKLAEAH